MIPKPFERLPANVVPKNYNLSLEPDLKNFSFKGNENVSVEVKSFLLNISYKLLQFNALKDVKLT